jgi:hypothetical protein
MIHVITYDELRAVLMAYLFDSETYDDGGDQ